MEPAQEAVVRAVAEDVVLDRGHDAEADDAGSVALRARAADRVARRADQTAAARVVGVRRDGEVRREVGARAEGRPRARGTAAARPAVPFALVFLARRAARVAPVRAASRAAAARRARADVVAPVAVELGRRVPARRTRFRRRLDVLAVDALDVFRLAPQHAVLLARQPVVPPTPASPTELGEALRAPHARAGTPPMMILLRRTSSGRPRPAWVAPRGESDDAIVVVVARRIFFVVVRPDGRLATHKGGGPAGPRRRRRR
mmetsp:Transcript_22163/g.87926  ORF Transcript_22163/g.87926 Transcript_22163/m.87926 type:complete len:260 (+) Transcript_22163:246-1025(+)